MVGVIFIDFRKVFDLVDHDILLKKMSSYKINQQSLDWFCSYLSDRTQKVSFDNEMSSQGNIKYGVPQGSILGPLLFLLFISDLPLYTDVFTDLYADDTTLYEIKTKLQKALSDLAQWCRLNGMVINIDKTKAMIVTTRQKRSKMEDPFHIILNDMPLSQVSNEKVLRVQVGNNLISHLPLSPMKRLNKTESAVFKLWMLYFQMISFQIIQSKTYIQHSAKPERPMHTHCVCINL